jgi:hypothetical protein
MKRPPMHLARPGQLPTPLTGHDSRQVLNQAARLRTACRLGDSAIRPHTLTSPIAQAEQLPLRPSKTPATRNSPGPRSANFSTPPLPQRHAATGTSHDQLDKDHRHNADDSAVAKWRF